MKKLWIFVIISMITLLEYTEAQKCGQKKKCTKLKGTCQDKEDTCDGTIYIGKKYCRRSKTCGCCVAQNCGQKKKCTKLKGTCQPKEDICNGETYVGKKYCKLFKTCGCCVDFGDQCYPIEGKCNENGAYCEKLDVWCKDGYEGVKHECTSDNGPCQCCKPVIYNDQCYSTVGRCDEKGDYCEKLEVKCKEGYEGVEHECTSDMALACQCCKPIIAGDQCYPIEGRCNENGAYCEKLDVWCKDGYEGVKHECTSDNGPCQCCKPIIYNDQCYPTVGRCDEKGDYCEKLEVKCQEGYEGIEHECTSDMALACKCCKPIIADDQCYPIEGRCTEKDAYCEKVDVKCIDGYIGLKQECASNDGPCQCCEPIIERECELPKQVEEAIGGDIWEFCQRIGGVSTYCDGPDGSKCRCCQTVDDGDNSDSQLFIELIMSHLYV